MPVQTFDGKMTTAAQLVEVELPYLRDTLCQNSCWVKYDGRSRRWKDIHPPVDAAQVLLKRFGDWDFPAIAGIISTPTLRPDGTILSKPGYDPATQLLLIDPPAMPDIPEKPTREDALAELELLNDLLFEFRFDDDGGVSRAVALSAIISTVCRGAYPVVPMHMITAPVAGSGKSYLLVDREPDRDRATDAGDWRRQDRGGAGEAARGRGDPRPVAGLHRQRGRRTRRRRAVPAD